MASEWLREKCPSVAMIKQDTEYYMLSEEDEVNKI